MILSFSSFFGELNLSRKKKKDTTILLMFSNPPLIFRFRDRSADKSTASFSLAMVFAQDHHLMLSISHDLNNWSFSNMFLENKLPIKVAGQPLHVSNPSPNIDEAVVFFVYQLGTGQLHCISTSNFDTFTVSTTPHIGHMTENRSPSSMNHLGSHAPPQRGSAPKRSPLTQSHTTLTEPTLHHAADKAPDAPHPKKRSEVQRWLPKGNQSSVSLFDLSATSIPTPKAEGNPSMSPPYQPVANSPALAFSPSPDLLVSETVSHRKRNELRRALSTDESSQSRVSKVFGSIRKKLSPKQEGLNNSKTVT